MKWTEIQGAGKWTEIQGAGTSVLGFQADNLGAWHKLRGSVYGFNAIQLYSTSERHVLAAAQIPSAILAMTITKDQNNFIAASVLIIIATSPHCNAMISVTSRGWSYEYRRYTGPERSGTKKHCYAHFD